jgi:hypothetical protein
MTNYFSVPLGYVAKYKFHIEKKEILLLDLDTKDQRKLRFRFESAFSHQRAQDALAKMCENQKHRDLFTFDYSKATTFPPGVQYLNEARMIQQVMTEYARMGVPALFRRVEIDDQTRISRKIDWPREVFVPAGLNADDHLRAGYSRVNGRFPILAYHNKKLNFSIWRSS